MKTKIKKLLFLTIPVIFLITATSVFAGWGSRGDTNDCPNLRGQGPSCVTFHNNGYTGATGPSGGGDFPYGVPFPTFNGYKDQETVDGRPFDERQFLYIESTLAPLEGLPIPSPWESWSNYNFAEGTSHTINFINDEPQRIGFWGYMHNNGRGDHDSDAAFGTRIGMRRWNAPEPQTEYKPRLVITANNTKPRTVWSDVTVKGSQPFTLEPKEFYVIREADFQRNEVEVIELNRPGQLQTLTTDWFGISSNPSYFNPDNPSYRFDASHLHYVKVYFSFEAIPEEEKEEPVCRSLQIVEPEDFFLGIYDVIEFPAGGRFPMLMRDKMYLFIKTIFLDFGERFVNEPLVIVVDADEGAISDFKYVSSDGDITFDGNQSPYRTESQSVLMNGDAGENGVEEIWVGAMKADNPDEHWSMCTSRLRILERKEEGPECANLSTSPGSAEPTVIEVGTGPHQIEIVELIDTEGNDYLVNDGPPTLIYCSTNPENVEFSPSGHELAGGRCMSASAEVEVGVIAHEPAMVIIEVAGAEEVCNDNFRVRQAPEAEEECLHLGINQANFTAERSTYSVTVVTDPDDANYRVEWTVEDQNGNPYNNFPVALEGNEIDLDDYGYTFTPGDTLRARVIDLDYDGDICEDMRTTIPEECTEFELDTDKFERGRNQEICVTRTDWPYFDEVYYETSDGKEGILQVTDDCFILPSEIVENANWIDIWVPDWKDVCIWRLTHEVRPPDFDKNVKTQDARVFSNRAVASFSDRFVNYEITYEHKNDSTQYVTIYDTIGRVGYIQGYIADRVIDIDGTTPQGGRIYYRVNSMRVTVAGENIERCGDPSADLCYEGSIGNSAGVTIYNVPERTEVKIFYDGEIRGSEVTPENCSDPEHIFNQLRPPICGEIYPNMATFEDELDFEGESHAEVLIPCPYIIIRAGGDVFFENPFDFGADTLYCADIANVDVPIIVGEEPTRKVVRVGEAESIPRFDHRLCKAESAVPGYEEIPGISSLICEISLVTAEYLSTPAIVQNIENNKQKIARYGANLGTANVRITGQEDKILQAIRDDVYVLKNADLTFDNGFANVEFNSGTHTFIVENGDVYINSNIVYRDGAVRDPRNIASLAIIVLNGNIIVDNDVTETSGVIFVQGADTNTGMVCAEPAEGDKLCEFESSDPNYSGKQFVHYGSIYGDIAHLFKHRTYVGEPGKEEGAVVIRFDNRIFMNTPAVLNELVDVTQYVF